MCHDKQVIAFSFAWRNLKLHVHKILDTKNAGDPT